MMAIGNIDEMEKEKENILNGKDGKVSSSTVKVICPPRGS